MKTNLFFCLLIVGLGAYAQPTCQLKHQHLDDLELHEWKSGNESLRSDTVNVSNYSIYLDFTLGGSGVMSGNCEVKFEALMDINTISLDLLQLNIDSIVYQGNPITYSYNDTLIVVNLGGTLSTGSIDSVTVYYGGSPQMDPSGWGGFYSTAQYYYNLGVGFGSDPHNYGRVWHPCFDNFVERATYDFQILTNNNFTAYCNGTRTNVQTVGTDSLLTTWVLSTEIPSYLASFAVSDYTHVSQVYSSVLQGGSIPIWLAAREPDTTNLKNSFTNLQGALSAFESAYGPYVWERIGYVLVPFNSGAMEHATNIAYPLLTANGALTYETLMAHELSHHWWGNWVTCETAEEMWINEGLAVYSEHLFTESIYGSDAYMNDVRDNHYNVLHRAHIDDSGHYSLNAVPIAYTYGEHSYRKGSDVMHTLRGYLGDANFFAGLKAVQTALGGGNASSEQFRDEMNTIAGVDVTDFFDDWILQPGFSQFSIVKMTAVQNGINYDIELLVDQKLKGAATYHNNVPMQVTFMDANWNTHTEMTSLSGDFQTLNFTIPINPVYSALNMDEKINDAVTAEAVSVTSTGTEIMNYANVRINVSALSDSCFMRVEHNWVYADGPSGGPANVVLSQDRYWNVHGVNLGNITAGTLKFDFNGMNTPAGDLDNSIMEDVGGQSFIEDSLVLMYRPNAQAVWQIHPDYFLNTTGSATDRSGFLQTNSFMPGQYCFGYRVHSVGIAEKPISGVGYSIYPNPADDSIYIDLTDWEDKPYAIEIYAINGILADKKGLKGAQINQLPISELEAGTYIVILTDGNATRYGSKRIIIQ